MLEREERDAGSNAKMRGTGVKGAARGCGWYLWIQPEGGPCVLLSLFRLAIPRSGNLPEAPPVRSVLATSSKS